MVPPLAQLNRLDDANVGALAPLLAQSSAHDHLDEGLRAPVQDRQFQVINLHDRVIDPHADERRQQMFGRGDQHTLLHQAGGIADFRNVSTDCFNRKTVEVSAAKHNAFSGRRWQHAQAHRGATVQTYSLALDRRPDCLFKTHKDSSISGDVLIDYRGVQLIGCGYFATEMTSICGK